MPAPEDINPDASAAENLEIDSAFSWEAVISARLLALGFAQNGVFFAVVGQGLLGVSSTQADGHLRLCQDSWTRGKSSYW